MALGNSNPKRGDRGSRFNYELGQLQVLNKILEALDNLELSFSGDLGDINLNTDNIENLLQGINGSVETPYLFKLTDGPSSIAAGYFAISITNVGLNDGTLLGEVLGPGEQIEYSAKTGNRMGSFDYDTTTYGGTTFLVVATKI